MKIKKSVRTFLRSKLIEFALKLLNSEELKSEILSINREFVFPRYDALKNIKNEPTDYQELPSGPISTATNTRDDIVFITGRFRSGSTLMWNIFRHLDNCTSYYEPLHERRWFDSKLYNKSVDSTHIGVDNYWSEFVGLDFLGDFYQADWVRKNLFMDESSFDRHLFDYINGMIDSAKERPIMQFNRIDFRLPWIKKHFPNGKIIHIFRNPRDQYLSFLTRPEDFPFDSDLKNFTDNYFLKQWANSLKYHFPFLDTPQNQHPYETFYIIWKLSYLVSRKYADLSIQLESLIEKPKTELANLFTTLGISSEQVDSVSHLVKKQEHGKWKRYASHSWFESKETACEKCITHFFDGLN